MHTDTLSEVISAYLELQHNDGTRRGYAQTLEHFAENFGRSRSPGQITPDDIDAWESLMHERGLAAATIASCKKRMKAFWSWCVEREIVEVSPARFVKIRKRRINLASKALAPDIRGAMWTEVQTKYATLPRLRDTAILALIMTYGARSIDVARLTVQRVNFAQEWIVWNTKGNNEDRRYLPPQTASHLREWMKYRQTLNVQHSFVFVNIRTDHGPLQAESIQTMFKRLALKASGEMHGPHSARHLRAQELLDAGFAREVVAEILGHSSIDTLTNYANQDWERQKSALLKTELGIQPPHLSSTTRGKVVDIDPNMFRDRFA